MEKYRILCVDDDIMTLNMLEDILTGAEYDVSLAKSGAQAVKLLERGIRADLILLDVDMPEMDGYDTFEKIRKVRDCERIPIIFLTGMNAPDFEIRGLEIGASDYIAKPFFKNVLIARIRGQLRNAGRTAEAAKTGPASCGPEVLERLKKELNESELQIVGYIADGLTNQEIADITHYSYNYVKKMSSSILGKLEFTKRSEIRKLLRPEKVTFGDLP